MNAIDLKRVEFRHYLETNGVMDALSYALIKLYDENPKPSDPVAFVRHHFQRPTDDNRDDEATLVGDSLIDKQRHELAMARQEIAKLRETLNLMANDPSTVDNKHTVSDEHPIFYDPKYEGTILKKHLVKDQFETLCETYGKNAINALIVHADALNRYPTGLYLSSSECYTKFAPLIDPMIMELHKTELTSSHPAVDYGDFGVFQRLELESITSIELSCSRSLKGYPFVTSMSEADLEEVLSMVQDAIQSKCTADDEIDGEFYKITDVKENEPIYDDLLRRGIGFRSLNATDHRMWPVGRGLYVNSARTQAILVNEDDHLRFICKESSSEYGATYEHLVNLIHKVDDKLTFDWSEKYGWLTINPLNIGSSIRCTVRIQYAGEMAAIEKFCKLNDIRLTAAMGDGKTDDECFVEVSNGKVFGLSEFDGLKLFYDNLIALGEVMKNASTNRNEDETAEDESHGDGKNTTNHSIEAVNEENQVNDASETAPSAANAGGYERSEEMPSDEVAEHGKNAENVISESKESINDGKLDDGILAGNGIDECSGQTKENVGNADAGGNDGRNENEAEENDDGMAQLEEEKPSESRHGDEEPSEEMHSQGKSNDGNVSDEKPIDGELNGEQLDDEKPSDEKLSDEKLSEEKLSDEKLSAEKPSNDEANNDDESPSDGNSNEKKPTDEKPTYESSNEGPPNQDNPGGEPMNAENA